ncbi:hypothetical protein PHYBLDRAFT_70060 [Phycomyces blakesleeanus NRRL 1555(-)]|uniref:Uncharacterized protein n=1 Tax=Phycomyces blakesleeanus (strain ATCC 8743b / DSM 1359 / FGSC 10004 / NBRC 33097 / NRRL 1555) TaxID=763407 RepID=A0A162N6F9_PHYB8|nr:hypothetical protein PHYBLDRAFT_70060 [Phycomyces blakesleeanus NRRL 1555(-)]OAD71608.1 hypothetical protein PHYBLDRAFT_70060 [Phycomyces blakesleeanus NRRL 1555(-)]|eukprot:XP_018289648.1 hypothetical protein PHYBLDRAFT_70060 [Phycomyces blakesleeanus NRRL 1555(-)]
MPSIKKTLPHKCGSCKKTYSNMKMAEKCLTLCLKNQLENMRNAHLSATPLLSMPSQSVSAAIPDLMLKENTSTISHESTDGNNSTDLDDPMRDIDCESEIESSTSSLIFDFSQPSPVPSNNDAKNLEFIKVINDFDISHQAHENLAAHLNSILGICMMFNDAEEVACKHCGEARYKSNKTDKDGIPIVKKTMVQIPLARQIVLSLANNGTRHEMLYRHNHEQKADGSKADIFDGHAYQSIKHLFSGENDAAISLSVDSFAPHNIPGPSAPLDFWSFLKPILADLKVLQEEGMVVVTPTLTIRAKVHVLVVTSDILEVAKLAYHTDTTMCTLESFQNFDPASLPSKGLVGQSSFSSLASFTGPLFLTLDKMHGLCHGIDKQVWGLIDGKYEIKHSLFLPANVLKEIGVAMAATRKTILTAFHGSWRNISKYSRYFKAVDWADFLLFIVPTLVAKRVRDTTARKALLGLVQACNLLMSWELSAEKQTSIKRKLQLWNMYLEDLYWNDKIEIMVFTINQHLLQHYPVMISAFGPPCAYSTRSMERAIGKYSRAIKSNSAIGVNAGNIMVRLAHTRRLLTDSNGGKWRDVVLQYEDMSAGWPITSEGEHAGADSNIEFWRPLGYKTIDDSFKDISCLLILIQDFYRSKGVECGMIEPAIITSRKAFINGCVIDFSFAQNTLREVHHVCLQVQVDLFTNVRCQYIPIAKDFFGKVILFFEHENSGKRWPLVLVLIYSTVLYNGIPVVVNGQLKPKVVHLADVKELVVLWGENKAKYNIDERIRENLCRLFISKENVCLSNLYHDESSSRSIVLLERSGKTN